MGKNLDSHMHRTRAGRAHDQNSVDALVENHRHVVDAIARRICSAIPNFASIELRDLIQAGNVGLVNAIDSYSAETGVPFEVYARFRIRGEMLDALRKLDAASRTLRAWQRRIRRTAVELKDRLNREPSEEEISGQLGVAVHQFRRKTLDIRLACAVTQSNQRSDRMEDASREQPGPSETRPDAMQSELERKKLVRYAVSQLPERPRRIIVMYYQQEYTMREIGEIMRLDESRISQIHKGALRAMAENLRLSGIRSATDL